MRGWLSQHFFTPSSSEWTTTKMCGIAGYWDKSNEDRAPGGPVMGATVLGMLKALDSRGPDSAGVALFGPATDNDLVLRIKLGDNPNSPSSSPSRAEEITRRAAAFAEPRDITETGAYLRFKIDGGVDHRALAAALEAVSPEVEVVSMGRSLEIVKQVGSPSRLDETFRVSETRGSHGIGHTRLSTESKVDLSHSQPFWAHGCPDLAIVHNGHITNYHKLRRQYEQRGVRFYTDNDSEIIAVYVAGRMAGGLSLEETLAAALADLDGSFSCLVATAGALGFVKDAFAHKPLVFAETDRQVLIATEEIAIRAAMPGAYDVREARAGEIRVWKN